MRYYRAKAYAVLGLPKRPKVYVDVLFGPWKDRLPPAELLARALGINYPNLQTTIQQATVLRS